MFKDVFDLSKKRTLKESIGFFIVHSTIVLTVMFFLELIA
jgi:hypothetical protein